MRDSSIHKIQVYGDVNPNTSYSGGGCSGQTAQKRHRQRRKSEETGTVRERGAGVSQNEGAIKEMERHTSEKRICERSCSVTASQSAHEENLTSGNDAVIYVKQLNNARGRRGEGEWSAGLGNQSSREDDGSFANSQEGVRDERVKEEGGGGCGSGASAQCDIGELLRVRKRPGPNRKSGPVSKGCIDSRVSKCGEYNSLCLVCFALALQS